MAPVLLTGSRELDERGYRGYSMMGRLRPDATVTQAQAELDAAMRQLAREYPASNATMRGEVLPFWQAPRGPQRMLAGALELLQAIMLMLLLAVCGNTANLVLARASTRHREVGVRLALGAGPRADLQPAADREPRARARRRRSGRRPRHVGHAGAARGADDWLGAHQVPDARGRDGDGVRAAARPGVGRRVRSGASGAARPRRSAAGAALRREERGPERHAPRADGRADRARVAHPARRRHVLPQLQRDARGRSRISPGRRAARRVRFLRAQSVGAGQPELRGPAARSAARAARRRGRPRSRRPSRSTSTACRCDRSRSKGARATTRPTIRRSRTP